MSGEGEKKKRGAGGKSSKLSPLKKALLISVGDTRHILRSTPSVRHRKGQNQPTTNTMGMVVVAALAASAAGGAWAVIRFIERRTRSAAIAGSLSY